MMTGIDVAKDAAKACGVSLGDVLTQKHGREAARARAAAVWVMRHRWQVDPTGWVTIAETLEFANSGSAFQAYKRALKLREDDPVFAATTDAALERARRP